MGMFLAVVICCLSGMLAGAAITYALMHRQKATIDRAREDLMKDKTQLAERERQVAEILRREDELHRRQRQFESQVISYERLRKENEMCKRDLRNIDMQVQKSRLDASRQRAQQEELDKRAIELASRYLQENVKLIIGGMRGNNFTASRQRLLDVIERCRRIGFEISAAEEARLIAELKEEFERAVRAEVEREEQARIRARIREEESLQREIDREMKQAAKEKASIQAALDRAIAEARTEHTQEVEALKARLAEAEAKSQRALSMAQQTKAGNVYVISNIGAFGEGVYKVGMTRRLDPYDRVRELGDASVPFPFDVHMMVSSPDAPSLENALHRALHNLRINKVNPRKEFFRVELEMIRQVVESEHGKVEYVADAQALEYRQSMTMSDEEAEYIEQVFEKQESGRGEDGSED